MVFGDFLLESPESVPSFETVMNDRRSNIKEGGRFFRRLKETYVETENSILFRTGDWHNGYIVLLDKRDNYVNYFARFEYKKLAGEKYVTQVGVWRSSTTSLPRKEYKTVAGDVFFDILLKKFKRIASDQEQTDDGQRFWRERMQDAVHENAGYKVGLLKVDTKEINYYDKSKFDTVSDWIDSLEYTWGSHPRYRRYRFIVES